MMREHINYLKDRESMEALGKSRGQGVALLLSGEVQQGWGGRVVKAAR